jgi:hypothetical protein
MNISDFVARGNPEDMDDDFEPLEGVEASKSPEMGHEKPVNAAKRGPLPKNTFIIIAVLVLSSSASFGLGLLAQQGSASANGGGLLVGAAPNSQPASATLSASALDASGVPGAPTTGATSANGAAIPTGGEVIADSSAHTYYLPWCPQVSKISKTNTVWFATEQMAKSAGYTAGPNCPGI